MILYICRTKGCGFFRDITPISFFANNMAQVGTYNKTLTHCPNGHGEMYQVQKGDRLAVIAEDEKIEGKNE